MLAFRPSLLAKPSLLAAGHPCLAAAGALLTAPHHRSALPCTPHPPRLAEGVVPSTTNRSRNPRSGRRKEGGTNARKALEPFPVPFEFSRDDSSGEAPMPQGGVERCDPFLLTQPSLLPALPAGAAIHAGPRPPMQAQALRSAILTFRDRPSKTSAPSPPRRGCRFLHPYPIASSAERTREGGRREGPFPPQTLPLPFNPLCSFSSGGGSADATGGCVRHGNALRLPGVHGSAFGSGRNRGRSGLIRWRWEGGGRRFAQASVLPSVPATRFRVARPGLTLPRGNLPSNRGN
jgi:hypothetical protein